MTDHTRTEIALWFAFVLIVIALLCHGCGAPINPMAHTGPVVYGMWGDGPPIINGDDSLNRLKELPCRVVVGSFRDWRNMAADAQLNDGPVIVVGYSAGAAAASKFSRLAPITKLFLIDPPPPISEDWKSVTISEGVEDCWYWVTKLPNNSPPLENKITHFYPMPSDGHSHLDIDNYVMLYIIENIFNGL